MLATQMSTQMTTQMTTQMISADLTLKKERTMKTHRIFTAGALAFLASLGTLSHAAFNSGSTGIDGALSPTVNTQVQLPASGILNYTTVNIPVGVTVTFTKNTTNTPVILLVSGDATIAGTLNVSGNASKNVGAAGDGNIGDDGLPGEGAPGGYDGGRGGKPGASNTIGGTGLGPGAGQPGDYYSNYAVGGGGAGFGVIGASSWGSTSPYPGLGGSVYGSSALLPLVGGSGGGGAAGGASFAGSGGGGGGGALLLAASGTVSISGSVLANGGASGASAGQGSGATGGGGSGGAVRIVATTISGNGSISALGGAAGASTNTGCNYTAALPCPFAGGVGGAGRIRLEAEIFSRTAASTPVHVFAAPSTVFIAGLPSLKIKTVAGAVVPASPTGVADIALPATQTNPVAVTLETTAVPVGNSIKVTVTPAYGATTSAVSDALVGSTALATASASVTLPQGASTLSATLTYTVTASVGNAMSQYAQGEQVEKIRLAATPGKPSTSVTLITVSGKEYEVPAALLAQGG